MFINKGLYRDCNSSYAMEKRLTRSGLGFFYNSAISKLFSETFSKAIFKQGVQLVIDSNQKIIFFSE